MISCQEQPHHLKIYLSPSSGINAFNSLPCLIFLICLRDTFIPEGRKLRDPRRLYAPGRMYHIVERKFCRCGRYPPDVRTAIPVDGRFEHIVLSCNATSDHGIIWIEKESEKAFARLKEASAETATTPPKVQKIERLKTIEKEHSDALERAVSLNIPHVVGVDEDESSTQKEEEHKEDITGEGSHKQGEDSSTSEAQGSDARTNWNEVIEKLFNRDETGKLRLKRETTGPK